MQDWNYLHTNDFEITLELGCYKYPPHSQLHQYWKDNQEALLAYIEKVHMGIKGFVLDKTTGEPIKAANASAAGATANATIIEVRCAYFCIFGLRRKYNFSKVDLKE